MKILLHDEKTLLMSEVYNSVVFDNDEGELLAVCMRDDGFEIIAHNKNDNFKRTISINSKRLEDWGTGPFRKQFHEDNPPPKGEKKDL